jgi:flagellar hook-associated protein 2
MDWSNVISEIITADSAPMTELQAEVTSNQAKITTYKALESDATSLQTAVQGLEDSGTNVFTERTASMADSGSSWTPSASASTPTGSYSIDVTQLATQAMLTGATGISGPLSASSTVSGVTLATMNTATAVTAGTFTVNGQPITVSLTDSLQDVFNAIETATGTVSAAYNPTSDTSNPDTVTLTNSGGPLVLGAANDTSNFLQVMGLAGNGTDSVTSASALGSVSLSSPIASAGLKGTLSGQDSSGNGSFAINGVTISYNVNTDSLQDVIDRINGSSAGVTASFDSQTNQMVLVNNVTGNVGITASDNASAGNLLSVLGLASGSALQLGKNALFTVNNGPSRTALTNNLSSEDLGVSGLALSVNTEDTQTVQVAPDSASMTAAIQAFITAYNQFTTDIGTDTAITSNSSGTVTTSILSGNFEVSDWGQELQALTFGGGGSGTIQRLDQIGIGFSGTSNQLSITDSAQLQTALSSNPQGVAAFFQSGSSGLASTIDTYLSQVVTQNIGNQTDLTDTNSQLNDQISVLQTYLTNQQAALTAEFTAMESAIEQSQSEEAYISGITSSGSSSSSSAGSTISSSAYSTPSSTSSTSGSSSSSS